MTGPTHSVENDAPPQLREVTQTILLGDPSGRLGNCLQAAVASLLDLPLDDVPHFVEVEDWWPGFVAFAAEHGYSVDTYTNPPAFGLAVGTTNRSGETHSVVVRDGEMVWDPHPTRAGLTGVKCYIEFTRVIPPGSTDGDAR